MKPTLPHKGMPPHIYIILDGSNHRIVDPTQWLHPAKMQRYIRADLYEKARARIKYLEDRVKLAEMEE